MQPETHMNTLGATAGAATVLIVDDEKDLRHLLDFNLKQAGYRTVQAATGEEALAQVARHTPHMILLDLNLPDLAGTEVARRLKADPDTREIPIIMLTARGGEADRIAGFELGAEDYVPKPFSVRELVLRLNVVRRRLSSPIDQPAESLGAHAHLAARSTSISTPASSASMDARWRWRCSSSACSCSS